MAKVVNAAEFAEKWGRRTKAAVPDFVRGVQRTNINPMQAAVAQQSVMQTNLNAAIDSGRWADGLNAVSISDWKDKTANVGAQRISAGVDAAAPKVAAFAAVLLPHIEAGQALLEQTPRGDFEANLNRMNTFVRHMHDMKGRA